MVLNKIICFQSVVTATVLAGAMLVSCNKDDVIEIGDAPEEAGGLPAISLPIAGNCLTLATGSEYTFNPEIGNCTDGGFSIEWAVDGALSGTDDTFTFTAAESGDHTVSVTVTNAEGSSTRDIAVKVSDRLPYRLSFPTPSYLQSSTNRYTFAGRPVYLTPTMENLAGTKFEWSVDGVTADCTERTFIFTPDKAGEYVISLSVDDEATANVKVICVDCTETDRYRKAGAGSKATSTKVFEWVPAPGQFIGDTPDRESLTSAEGAVLWAEKRLEKKSFVSLGGFGGYIIVGFDHSIAKHEGSHDFAIMANAFFNASTNSGGSNEPGIVYVSQDVNGNGLPDDEWYELRGSETGKPETRQDYAVTYFRPAGPKMNVQWTDNYGANGLIEHLSSFHRQDYYYPTWIQADSYTLRGTCLSARTTLNPATGFWDNSALGWGYADNKGSDDLGNDSGTDGEGQRNGFMIDNAMWPDLTHINLQYIDFIKVQTGINSKAGLLGEVSTEVFNFQDLSLMK